MLSSRVVGWGYSHYGLKGKTPPKLDTKVRISGVKVSHHRKGPLIKIQTHLYMVVDCKNSPYFCVFKYARAVKLKVWSEAENREQDWRETLFSLASHAQDSYATLYRFLYWFWEKKFLICSLNWFKCHDDCLFTLLSDLFLGSRYVKRVPSLV